MIEQYIKYGLVIVLPIILIVVIPPILKRFIEALEKLSRIKLDSHEIMPILTLILTFGLILISIVFFVMISATLIRINLLSDEVDSGVIDMMFVVLVAYLSTLVAFLLFIREIYRGEHREIKKESIPHHGEN